IVSPMDDQRRKRIVWIFNELRRHKIVEKSNDCTSLNKKQSGADNRFNRPIKPLQCYDDMKGADPWHRAFHTTELQQESCSPIFVLGCIVRAIGRFGFP